jgi:hypothetical protein
VSYFVSARELSKLYGQAITIRNLGTGQQETIEIAARKAFVMRSGAEAYGFRADHHHTSLGRIAAFFKIFKLDVPQRRERSEFLISLGLAKLHPWLFQGVPYGWFPRTRIAGVEVIGHLTKFVGLQFGTPAEDLSVLMGDADWGETDEGLKRAYVAQLAAAIAALERCRIVHGDLSRGNVMIGPGPDGRTVCCLCDFDGFSHPAVPLLPRMLGTEGVRPLGSDGYQYPDLVERIAADPAGAESDLAVETDRFALAVLACEIMTWSDALKERLGRGQLLNTDIVRSRSLAGVPDAAGNLFPAGFALLERALTAGSVEAMPAPADWLEALGVPVASEAAFAGPLRVEFLRKERHWRRIAIAELGDQRAGDFAAVDAALAAVSFERDRRDRLRLAVRSAAPLALSRDGRSEPVPRRERRRFEVQPGDVVEFEGWRLAFEAAR